jgi:hypothetical protein
MEMKTDRMIDLGNEFDGFLKIANGLGIKYHEDTFAFYEYVSEKLGFSGHGELYYDVYDYVEDMSGIIKAIGNKETIYLEFEHDVLKGIILRFGLYLGERFDVEVLIHGNCEVIATGLDGADNEDGFNFDIMLERLRDILVEDINSKIKPLQDLKESIDNSYEKYVKDSEIKDYKLPIILKDTVRNKLEKGMIFTSYKALLKHVGLQRKPQISGYERQKYLDMLSPFVKIEKVQDHSNMVIVKEIYVK